MLAGIIISVVSAIAGVWLLVIWPRNGKLGVSACRVRCRNCRAAQPFVRFPANVRQCVHGGTTCPACRWELDRRGNPVFGGARCKSCGYILLDRQHEYCPECGVMVSTGR